MAIGIFRVMQPGEWYVATPDNLKRLFFANAEDATEVKAFMEAVFAAGRDAGLRESNNSRVGLSQQITDHIEECERFAAILREHL